MSTHTIHATITVDATNSALLAAVPGAAGQDERAQLQAAVNAGLRELKSIGARYGITVTDASATVE